MLSLHHLSAHTHTCTGMDTRAQTPAHDTHTYMHTYSATPGTSKPHTAANIFSTLHTFSTSTVHDYSPGSSSSRGLMKPRILPPLLVAGIHCTRLVFGNHCTRLVFGTHCTRLVFGIHCTRLVYGMHAPITRMASTHQSLDWRLASTHNH